MSREVLLALPLLALLGACSAHPTPHGVSLNPWDEDPERMQALERNGVWKARRDVAAWFPPDSVSDARRIAILGRLERGIQAAKRFVGKPGWSFRGDRRIYYYFPDERFVAHAPGGNAAFIPLWRIREDKAPWLHESLHLLLATPKGDWLSTPEDYQNRRMPLWLSEGLAESLAMEISAQEELAHFSPLIDVRASQLDALAAKCLREAPSDRVLAMIGGRGKLPELFGPDRVAYALPFYAGSTSFVRHLAARYGYAPLLGAIAAFDGEIEELEKRTGVSVEKEKADWLKAIGYAGRTDKTASP